MKYEDIKALVEKYGEDYLDQNAINQIFNIAKDSPSMIEQLENGVTQEWLELLKQRGVIYVYTDPRKPSFQDSRRYPCMEFAFQDEKDMSNPNAETKRTPVLRYAYQAQKNFMNYSTSFDKEMEAQRQLEKVHKKMPNNNDER